MASVTARLGSLERPDGSANYTYNGYSVIAAVNGPVEVQRRDEVPDEAAIDVVVRPASGVGAIRERYLESMICGVLQRAIHTKAHPRTLIQVTLQVTSTPLAHSHSGKISQASLNLMLLPSLLNAALLAVLTSSLPVRTVFAATGLVADSKHSLHLEPSSKLIAEASSTHVFCFGADGSTMLYVAEGPFIADNLISIEQHARAACLGTNEGFDGASVMEVDKFSLEAVGQVGFIKQTVLNRLQEYDAWRSKG